MIYAIVKMFLNNPLLFVFCLIVGSFIKQQMDDMDRWWV